MDVYRGSVLWWEINEAVRNLQDPQLARERLSCWIHMFLAYSSTEEPGGLINHLYITVSIKLVVYYLSLT